MDCCSLSPAPAPPSFFASHIQDLNTHAIHLMHQGDFVGAHISLNHGIELLEQQDSEQQGGQDSLSSTYCGAPSLQLVARDVPTAPALSPNHYTPSSASLAHQTLFHKPFAIVYHAEDSRPGFCSRCGGAGATTSQGSVTARRTTRTHEESEPFVLLWMAVLLYNRGLCQQLLALFVGPAHENGTYFKTHMQKALFSYETALNILETLVFLYHEQHQDEEDEEGCFFDYDHHGERGRGGGGQQEKQQRFLELALLNNCTYLYSCGVVTECDCQVQAEMFLHRIADCIQQTVEESEIAEQDSAGHAGRLDDQECVMDARTRNVFWANANVCFELLRQQHKQSSAAA